MIRRAHRWPLALLWLTLTAASAARCHGIPTSPTLPASFTLAVGQTVRAGTGLVAEVQFERIVSDSRCPKNVVCIHAGDAVVVMRLSVGGNQIVAELKLLDTSRRIAALDGYSVEFTQLDPYPIAGQQTKIEDYRASITIKR